METRVKKILLPSTINTKHWLNGFFLSEKIPARSNSSLPLEFYIQQRDIYIYTPEFHEFPYSFYPATGSRFFRFDFRNTASTYFNLSIRHLRIPLILVPPFNLPLFLL